MERGRRTGGIWVAIPCLVIGDRYILRIQPEIEIQNCNSSPCYREIKNNSHNDSWQTGDVKGLEDEPLPSGAV